MSKQQQILAQAKSGREPQSPQIYRRGRVTNSSAYYRGARPDVEAGKDQKVVADFLSSISKPLAQAMGQKVEEFAQAERDAGIAHFMNATPEQRAKMRNAIKSGVITESQSPYFREGVSIAYTKNLLGKYNQDLFLEYEDWKSKNDVSSESFDKFLDNFDSYFANNFETIHDSVLVEHFVPGQMGIRRQLQQMHTGRLAEDYREQAEYQKNGELFGIFKSYSDGVYSDLLKSDTPLGEELRNQESSNFKFGQNQEQMLKALKDKNITPATRKYFESSEYGRNFLESWDKLSEKKKPKVKSKPKETTKVAPKEGEGADAFAKRLGYKEGWKQMAKKLNLTTKGPRVDKTYPRNS